MADVARTRDKLLKLAEPVCAGSGYEVVDLRYLRDQGGWVVRVFIDRADNAATGRGIGFEDCERVSRELSAVFDVEDPLAEAYRLEVSSPGVDRPLRTASHFRRFIAEKAKITLEHGVEGRRNFTGTLVAVEDDDATVAIDVDGVQYRLPIADIAVAKLMPNWDALMTAAATTK